LTQPSSTSSSVIRPGKAPQPGNSSRLLTALGAVFIACYFLAFTWRGLLIYFTGDDLMNLYGYWSQPVSALVKGNLFFWTPSYRPFGGIIYLTLFRIFGFNPYPEYVLYFAVMLFNLWLAYRLFSRLGGSKEIGAIAVLLYAYHGKFDYLYYNGGSLYDVYCFLFFSSALLIYLRARSQDRFLGVWGMLGFLACLVCALNSKEMAVTLPAIVLLYELLFHPPDFRSLRALLRWCFREGRMALLGGVCVLIYLPAKLGSNGIAQDIAYVPKYTWARWLEDTGTFLGDVLYRNNSSAPLGVTPLTPLGIAVFYGILVAVALWLRSRVAWFGLFFFAITVLPVSFIPTRLGFVLYLPLAGLALYVAVCLVRFKESLAKLISDDLGAAAPAWSSNLPASAIALFLGTAVVMATIGYRYWPPAPDGHYSPYRITAAEFSRLYPKLPHGSRLLFVHSALDPNWDLVFLMRMYYRDLNLFITEMNGPLEQRIPLNKLPHYDHIFDYVNGHYVELDNADTLLSIKLHLLKVNDPDYAFGETMTIGKPGAAQYVVKGVLVGDAKADVYWTLDEPELQFRLSSLQHHVFRERFFLPLETLKKTGPLLVDFYVNGHHLDQTRFSKDGDVMYEHDVPENWLTTSDLTTVEMKIHNPYIAPRDGARLGVLLRAAGFSAVPVTL
jgi:hypothetical protein